MPRKLQGMAIEQKDQGANWPGSYWPICSSEWIGPVAIRLGTKINIKTKPRFGCLIEWTTGNETSLFFQSLRSTRSHVSLLLSDVTNMQRTKLRIHRFSAICSTRKSTTALTRPWLPRQQARSTSMRRPIRRTASSSGLVPRASDNM